MGQRKKISLQISSTGQIVSFRPIEAKGWGDNGQQITLRGEVGLIEVAKDGETQFSISIQEDGSIIITDYAGMCFESTMPQNFRLSPARKWK